MEYGTVLVKTATKKYCIPSLTTSSIYTIMNVLERKTKTETVRIHPTSQRAGDSVSPTQVVDSEYHSQVAS